jgi:hypothetical protein
MFGGPAEEAFGQCHVTLLSRSKSVTGYIVSAGNSKRMPEAISEENDTRGQKVIVTINP